MDIYCEGKIVLQVAVAVAEGLLDSARLLGSVFISLRGPNKPLHCCMGAPVDGAELWHP